ncbi:hypothetical protein [Sutcliffiella rhizosphaerae]|nr:hypothetical protein [Sutcliffiella rhizosphaerae]
MNEVDNHQMYDWIKPLMKEKEALSIKKSFENGYHISLFGFLYPEEAKAIYDKCQELLETYPTTVYDTNEFINKYRKVADLSLKEGVLDEIYQNKMEIKKREDLYGFQNKEQLHLFLKINKVFDRHYVNSYWEKDNNILSIIKDVFPFFSFLPDQTLSKEFALYSNGFTSHLSHYLGFLHSLSNEDKNKVIKRFNQLGERDKEMLHIETAVENEFVTELKMIYEDICKSIDNELLNFYSPKSKDEISRKVEHSTQRHKLVLENPALNQLIIKDPVLITNRWVLNVFYEKLVLLNIKPLEKFYMNYLLSSFRYSKEEVYG